MPNAEGLERLAREAEAAALAVPGVSKSSGAGASASDRIVAMVISNGFAQGYRRTGMGVSMSAIAGEGTGMQRDYDYASAIHFADLRPAAGDVGREAGERAVKRLNPRKVKSQAVPVIYDRRVASGLIGHLLGAINGAAIARGTSFLKDALGQQIFGSHITIVEDPCIRRGFGSRPFDGEGLACQSRNLIDAGVLTGWILDLRSARQLGLKPTGQGSRGLSDPSSSNVYLPAGASSRRADPRHLAGTLCDGTHRIVGQHGDGRLQPGSLRLLDREWRTHLSGERDHHRRKPQGHVPDHRARRRPGIPLIGECAKSCLVEGLTIAGL